MPLFADEVHEEFATWLLGFAPYGGADYGEVQALAGRSSTWSIPTASSTSRGASAVTWRPRVAAFEHRLAAIIADPGQLDVGGRFAAMAPHVGLDKAAVARLPELSPDDEAKLVQVVSSNRGLAWKLIKRGFWTNGADSMSAFLAEMAKWRLTPELVAQITCPVFVAAAESDTASDNAKDLYDLLPGPKQFVQFTDADGAGDHCEILNRSLANRTFLDWLDDTLGVTGGRRSR